MNSEDICRSCNGMMPASVSPAHAAHAAHAARSAAADGHCPPRLLPGWALLRAERYPRRRFRLSRWTARFAAIPVVAPYAFVVSLSQYLTCISHPLSSRDAARTCSCSSRRESKQSEDAERGAGAKQRQQGRNEVKSSGERRFAESPEKSPGHQRASRISRRAFPAERHGHILPRGPFGPLRSRSGPQPVAMERV